MVTIPTDMINVGEFFNLKVKSQLKASIQLRATCMIYKRFVPVKHTLLLLKSCKNQL